MTAPQNSTSTMTSPHQITTAADAGALVAHFNDVMDQLINVVQQETELVRAGRLSSAGKLAQPKGDLARLYIADTLRLRASMPFLAKAVPAKAEALRERHDKFRSLLQINLTVLATAHAVSEGIIRGVADELTKKDAPQTYGASGRMIAPNRTTDQPMALRRSL